MARLTHWRPQRQQKRALEERAAAEKAAARGGAPAARASYSAADGRTMQGDWSAQRASRGVGPLPGTGGVGDWGRGRQIWEEDGGGLRGGGEDEFEEQIRVARFITAGYSTRFRSLKSDRRPAILPSIHFHPHLHPSLYPSVRPSVTYHLPRLSIVRIHDLVRARVVGAQSPRSCWRAVWLGVISGSSVEPDILWPRLMQWSSAVQYPDHYLSLSLRSILLVPPGVVQHPSIRIRTNARYERQ